jgi:hypothetical protein
VPTEAAPAPSEAPHVSQSFESDLGFLREHTRIVLLESDDRRAQVAVAPEYQGRVMTSTARGGSGQSFGWIHRSVIQKGERQPHMTVVGGEDRFWLGPEGGQFGLYFPKGAPFTFDSWQVPEGIDWGAWAVSSETRREVSFEASMELRNHSGTSFSIAVRRSVRLLAAEAIREHLGVEIGPDASVVAYESDNVITNSGREAWTYDGGLVSIWILGMFTPSPETTVVIPIREGDEATLGPAVRDDYFGAVPPERLKVREGVVLFRGDGRERGKIGIPRARALPIAGSYDAAGKALTLVQFTLPDDAKDYVDSRWEIQKAPYSGDVINSYNDGPPEPFVAPLGPFYEIESSSPVKPLAPGESLRHVHRTFHIEASEAPLEAVARTLLRTGLQAIRAF